MKSNNILSFSQSITNGELIDVSSSAEDAGFAWPVALAKPVYSALSRQCPGEAFGEGLWELLFAAWLQAQEAAKASNTATEVAVNAVVARRRGQGVVLKAQLVVGVDEQSQRPCIVLLKPDGQAATGD